MIDLLDRVLGVPDPSAVRPKVPMIFDRAPVPETEGPELDVADTGDVEADPPDEARARARRSGRPGRGVDLPALWSEAAAATAGPPPSTVVAPPVENVTAAHPLPGRPAPVAGPATDEPPAPRRRERTVDAEPEATVRPPRPPEERRPPPPTGDRPPPPAARPPSAPALAPVRRSRRETPPPAGRRPAEPAVAPRALHGFPIDRPPPEPESAPPEPIVHVTIGRVEIRAGSTHGTGQPAAPARPPRAPAMSLEDYLQRRSGGAR